jgi:glycosyltransferase involved in cell wall biosynthesis
LCVNQHTLDNLQYFKVPVTLLKLWPFQLHDRPHHQAPACDKQMRFLIVGGFNADKRKQARKVMQAFAFAYRDRTDVHLTVLSQGGSDFAQIPPTFPNITVKVGPRSYAEIVAEYQQHHVVIMCSRAEGLGLPFYEAMRAGCAVISLNTAMFREVVTDNGWLIKAQTEPVLLGQTLIGNDDAIVHTYTFEPVALTKLLQQLTPPQIALAQAAARAKYEQSLEGAVDQWKAFKPKI